MKIRTCWMATVLVAAFCGAVAATPPPGASSSASASLSLAVQNRGFDAAAKPFDARLFAWGWSNCLSLLDTTPTGFFLYVR